MSATSDKIKHEAWVRKTTHRLFDDALNAWVIYHHCEYPLRFNYKFKRLQII